MSSGPLPSVVNWNIATDSGAILGPGINWGARGLQEILQNVRHILTTRIGTVRLFREFGTDTNFLDRPIGRAQLMISAIARAVATFEPRVEVISVDFTNNTAPGYMSGQLNVNITLRILTTAEYVHQSQID